MYWPSGVQAGDTMICGPIVGLAVLADRRGTRAVGVGDPQVLDAGAIGQERDALAVGRPRRLALERQPAHDARGLAAADRHRVEIAQQVEEDRAPIGRHVDLHPGHLVGRKLDRFRRLQRETLDGLGILGLPILAAQRNEADQAHHEQGQGQFLSAHGRSIDSLDAISSDPCARCDRRPAGGDERRGRHARAVGRRPVLGHPGHLAVGARQRRHRHRRARQPVQRLRLPETAGQARRQFTADAQSLSQGFRPGARRRGPLRFDHAGAAGRHPDRARHHDLERHQLPALLRQLHEHVGRRARGAGGVGRRGRRV